MTSTNYTTNSQTRVTRKIYGIIGALLTLIIPFFIMQTSSHIESSQSLCPHKLLTGLPCPGCGITKSIIFFYHGDIWKSLSYHVLGPFVVLLCIVVVIVLLSEIITGREYFNGLFFSKKLAYVLGISLAGYHIIRLVYFISTHSITDILKESIWM